jgi:hypothetical protein
MSKAEAAVIFQTGNYALQHHPPTNDQTYCVYPGSAAGVSLIAKVTWSNSQVTNFEKLHSGTNKLTTGTLPSGQSLPVPHFTKITVDGTTAYWSAHQSIPISGTSTYPSLLSAEMNGYVVSLSATGLSEMQNEHVMSTMLRRL